MNLREFDDVVLDDTFVLDWQVAPNAIVFRVLAHLEPSHPLVLPPASGEWACYRYATIVFPDAATVSGLPPGPDVPSTTDPDGSVDYGTIDSLQAEAPGHFVISGGFGRVSIESGSPRLNLDPEA